MIDLFFPLFLVFVCSNKPNATEKPMMRPKITRKTILSTAFTRSGSDTIPKKRTIGIKAAKRTLAICLGLDFCWLRSILSVSNE